MKVNASAIASLIGENPYKSVEEAIRDVLLDNNLIDVEDNSDQILDELEKLCELESTKVCESTSIAELESANKDYETKVMKTILEDVVMRTMNMQPILSSPVELSPVVLEHVEKMAKNSTPEQKNEIVNTLMTTIPTKQLQDNPIAFEAFRSAVKMRGTKQEEVSTNKFETATGVQIRSRNSKCYIYHVPDTKIVIAGRVDGLQGDDSVIETKTRRRFWKSPPTYDIIQLRCYMKLTNRRIGVLNEQFPNGTSRTTRIQWSDSIWDDIETRLVDVLENLWN
jgi:predicted phage-related endonuclease